MTAEPNHLTQAVQAQAELQRTGKEKRQITKRLSDVFFKFLFGNEKHKKFLISLLNSCLAAYAAEKPLVITDLSYVNNELTPHRANLKYPVIDIAAKTDQGLVDIECQVRFEPSINDRLTYYLSSLAAENLYQGENYGDAPARDHYLSA